MCVPLIFWTWCPGWFLFDVCVLFCLYIPIFHLLSPVWGLCDLYSFLKQNPNKRSQYFFENSFCLAAGIMPIFDFWGIELILSKTSQSHLLDSPWTGVTKHIHPQTTNMEPENHPLAKKTNFRNLHFWVSCWLSGVYVDSLTQNLTRSSEACQGIRGLQEHPNCFGDGGRTGIVNNYRRSFSGGSKLMQIYGYFQGFAPKNRV